VLGFEGSVGGCTDLSVSVCAVVIEVCECVTVVEVDGCAIVVMDGWVVDCGV
jgi:hypothetical protein